MDAGSNRQSRGWLTFVAVGVTLGVGHVSIAASTSSTAALGYLAVLPMAAVAGLGAHFAQRRGGPRWRAALGLLLALAPPVLLGLGLRSAWYRTREAEQLARDERVRVDRHRLELAQRLAAARGREPEVVEAYLAEQPDDRAAVRAVLATPFPDAALLDRVARMRDLGLKREVASHPNSPPELLEGLWRESRSSWHFSVELAKNANTPPAVLEEVALDGNRLLPPALLAHPRLSCQALRNLQATLGKGYLPSALSAQYAAEAARRESELCPAAAP